MTALTAYAAAYLALTLTAHALHAWSRSRKAARA